MFQAFLIKYGEIAIKGKNRHLFEDALVRQIRNALKAVEGEFKTYKTFGRIFVEGLSDFDSEEVIEALQKVFGIVGICPMRKVTEKNYDALKAEVLKYMDEVYPDKHRTFKVRCRRVDKGFPVDSMTMNCDLGDAILTAYPDFKVDVKNPEILLEVEVREEIYIYSDTIPGPGGMPVGVSGKAMLLLSGGIDSPVAGWMTAKRGVQVEAVYFHAPPYTSERAKQKVVDLAKKVAAYAGPIRLHVVNFTDIQLAIYEKCPHDELTIIMRRYMMRIAEHFAKADNAQALITGESIGQVASQTMYSLACTDDVCTMPVFRPLIAMDKIDIIEISEKIDTYETSILPFEDCCTIFVAKHPVTKPKVSVIRKSENRLNEVIDELMAKAIETTDILEVRADS
ncbi:MAG: tRNA 4-thiouridine(8) synthase ThiI [Clostridiales bacterium]|nr:tRNA 4-thiouridine(8) synthase ThiI [Clostridiales bacterium]